MSGSPWHWSRGHWIREYLGHWAVSHNAAISTPRAENRGMAFAALGEGGVSWTLSREPASDADIFQHHLDGIPSPA